MIEVEGGLLCDAPYNSPAPLLENLDHVSRRPWATHSKYDDKVSPIFSN